MSVRLTDRLESALTESDRQLLTRSAKLAARLNRPLYLVGGPVRDCLLGRPIVDFDLTVEGNAIELAQAVARQSGSRVKVHHRFGTAKLILKDRVIDFAMTRTETYARPAALPDVTPGTIQTDLIRRDFTINAMAIRLDGGHYGELIDLYHGLDDLHQGLIRVLHDRSFLDDPTRLLRAARLEQRFDFTLESKTLSLIPLALPVLDQVSGDRLRHEFELIFREARPDKALRRLQEWGVLRQIDPNLQIDSELIEKLGNTAAPLELFQGWAWLFQRCSPQALVRITQRLNLPRADMAELLEVISIRAEQAAIAATPSPSTLYHALEHYHPRALEAAARLIDNERARAKIEHFAHDLRDVQVSIDGKRLQALGQAAGPALGRILKALRDAVLDGIVIGPRQEEEYARALIEQEAKSHE